MWAIPTGASSVHFEEKKKKKFRSRVPVLSLASRKPVRIRRSGRTGILGVTEMDHKDGKTVPHNTTAFLRLELETSG